MQLCERRHRRPSACQRALTAAAGPRRLPHPRPHGEHTRRAPGPGRDWLPRRHPPPPTTPAATAPRKGRGIQTWRYARAGGAFPTHGARGTVLTTPRATARTTCVRCGVFRGCTGLTYRTASSTSCSGLRRTVRLAAGLPRTTRTRRRPSPLPTADWSGREFAEALRAHLAKALTNPLSLLARASSLASGRG